MSRPQPRLFLRHATRCDAGSISLSQLIYPAAGREITTPSTLARLTLSHLLTTTNPSLDLNRAIRYAVSPTTTTSLIDRHPRPSTLDVKQLDAIHISTRFHQSLRQRSKRYTHTYRYTQVHTVHVFPCTVRYSLAVDARRKSLTISAQTSL